MDAGKLVDDATVLGMIRERMAQPDAAEGIHIWTAFPATSRRPKPWRRLLAAIWHAARVGGAPEPRSGHPVQAVDRPQNLRGLRTGVQRVHLAARCAAALPRPAATSPRLIQRPDDKEEVIGKRLEVYEAQTKPLIKHYEAAGLLRVVDADADVDTVFKTIERAVAGSP